MTAAAPSPFARGKRGNFNNRRDEVLRAAARVFAEQGFRQATLEDVAHELNITRPALYHYARSKDELAAQCGDRALEEIREAIVDARGHRTGREQVMAFFRRYTEIICEDFGRCFVLVNRREYSPDQQDRTRLRQREIDQALRAMIVAGGADGSLRAGDAADISRALFGAFNGVPVWYRPGAGRTPGQIAEDFLAFLLRGFAP
ncbi:MAG: TetR/AcrR family transcriptional regulator [Caulobacter sp.]|nr:TetR/AcrR family transcriptional regulator [Caulobacter sp.]